MAPHPQPTRAPSPPTGPVPWARVRSVAEQAIDLAPGERTRFVDSACAGDEPLRARVWELLHEDARASGTLEPEHREVGRALAAEVADAAPSLVGLPAGPFVLTRLLGMGGMGAVYEGLDQRLGRTLAVKVIHPAFASPALRRRFETEGRALAKLRHPGIATVFEVGTLQAPQPGATSPAGHGAPLPYLAMELVPEAQGIVRFATSQGLDFAQRIRLVRAVCEAVHHAHQKGVIHRDLKPGNILVDPASGQPKVIDFGIARVLGGERDAHAEPAQGDAPLLAPPNATLAGNVLGTPRYLAPEQCTGQGEHASELDVRTDVHALGVVLAEVLSDGQWPWGDADKPVPELLRLVRTTRPGLVVCAVRAPRAAWERDVQRIIAKALEKRPEERYQSAMELGEDLRRLLADEPLSVRGSGTLYELRLLARRNRGVVAALGALALALALGLAGTSVGLARAVEARQTAAREAQRAQRVAAFLARTFQGSAPADARSATDEQISPLAVLRELPILAGAAPRDREATRLIDVLRAAAEQIPAEFGDDPATQVRLSLDIGSALVSLTDLRNGSALLEAAARVADAHPDAIGPVDRFRIHMAWYDSLTEPKTFRPMEDGLERMARAVAPNDAALLIDLRLRFLRRSLDHQPPEETFARLSALGEEAARELGADVPLTWTVALARAHALSRVTGKRREALEQAQAAADRIEALTGPTSFATIDALNVATMIAANDPENPTRGEQALRDLLGRVESALSPGSSLAYELRSLLSLLLLRQGRVGEAEPLVREQLHYARANFGDDSYYTIRAKGRVARVLTWQGKDLEEAERWARQAAADNALYEPAGGPWRCYHEAVHAAALRQLGEVDRAIAQLRRIQQERERAETLGGFWPDGYIATELARALGDQGERALALAELERARIELEKFNDPKHPMWINWHDAQARLAK